MNQGAKYGTKITERGIVITCRYTATDTQWDGEWYVTTNRPVLLHSRETFFSMEEADRRIDRYRQAERARC